jgi:hypothetical protein
MSLRVDGPSSVAPAPAEQEVSPGQGGGYLFDQSGFDGSVPQSPAQVQAEVQGILQLLFSFLARIFGGAQSPTAQSPTAPAAPLSPARGGASGTSLGLSSTDQANPYMVDQLGGSAYNGDAGSTGTLDCGPASAVMALARLGLVAPPTSTTAEGEILDQRYKMHGQGAASQDTTWAQEAQGLQAAGATTNTIPETTSSIDAALARGSAVIIGGDPNRAWEGRLSAAGQYQESGDFGHFCTVLGKTADGHYVVNDPLSSAGSITVTAQELKDYLSYPSFNGAMEVSRG